MSVRLHKLRLNQPRDWSWATSVWTIYKSLRGSHTEGEHVLNMLNDHETYGLPKKRCRLRPSGIIQSQPIKLHFKTWYHMQKHMHLDWKASRLKDKCSLRKPFWIPNLFCMPNSIMPPLQFLRDQSKAQQCPGSRTSVAAAPTRSWW